MECGPDNCPIIDPRGARKVKAENLAKQGFTQEQIAAFLGVSHQTIGRDLKEFVHDGQTQPRISKRGRKGEGRPRGSRRKPQRRKTTPAVDQQIASAVLDGGKKAKEVETQFEVSNTVVRRAVATEEGRREIEPLITPDMLSMSAREKLAVAERAMQRSLNAEHAERMRNLDEEVRQRVLKESAEYRTVLDQERAKAHESEKWYRELINNHKPPFTPDEFKVILMCLHPDGERTAGKLNEAFRLFNSRKFQLTGERSIQRVA